MSSPKMTTPVGVRPRRSGFSRMLKAVTVGLVTGSLGALFALSAIGGTVERELGLSWLFHRRGPITPPPDVAVVGIDSRTGEQAGLSPLPREWPRSVHARVVDELTKRGASAIAFDMQFDRPRVESDDQLFAEAVKRSDRVALIQLITGKRQPVLAPDGRETGSVWIEGLVEPIESLRAAAKALATFPLPKIDASVSEFWAFKESVGDAPTLPAVMLQLHALPAWPAWRQSLESLHAPGLSDLPATREAIGNADRVSDWMQRLREALYREDGTAAGPEKPAADADARSRALVHALQAMYAGDPHRTLNFYGPPGTIPTIPYQDLLTGKTDFDFRDKAVFVGFSDLYDPGQPDRFYTVFTGEDGVDLSGVEIAATAFANLLGDQSIVPLDVAPTFVALFLFGLVVGALAYYLPAVVGVPLVLALGVAWAVTGQQLFERQQLWIPMTTPLLLQLSLALFLGLIAQYLLERGRRQHAGKALSYYLPEHVARELTVHKLSPDAYNREVYGACLSTDMSGFSAISERLSPGELAQFLSLYFEALAKAFRRHNVDLTEFRADCMMCAWIGDATDPSMRRKALLAALDGVEAIETFRATHTQLTASLRVGVQAGNFYLGHTGGGGHFIFSILGDTANTASRLESLNKHLGTRTLTTAAVVDGLDGLFLRSLGNIRLMGKNDDASIVEVMATQGQATPEHADLRDRFAAALAVYRDAEQLDDAVRAFESVQEVHPNDGPTRFFLAKCRAYLAADKVPPVPRALIMDTK